MNKKSAFTVIELIITTTIMAVVMIVAPVVVLKKAAKPKVKKAQERILICEGAHGNYTGKCIFSVQNSMLYKITNKGKSQVEEEPVFDYNKATHGIYEIELVGGGGGYKSDSSKFGYAGFDNIGGADKPTSFPTLTKNIDDREPPGILTGYYLLEAGAAGKNGDENNFGTDGGDSTICIININNIDLDDSNDLDNLSCDYNHKDTNPIIIAKAQGGFAADSDNQNIDLPGLRIHINRDKSEFFGQGGSQNSEPQRGAIIIK